MTGCIEFPTVGRAKVAARGHQHAPHVVPPPQVSSHAQGHSDAQAPVVARPLAPPHAPGPDAHAAPPPDAVPEREPHQEDAPPPAVIGVPIDDSVDDVDGPLSQRGPGEEDHLSSASRLR